MSSDLHDAGRWASYSELKRGRPKVYSLLGIYQNRPTQQGRSCRDHSHIFGFGLTHILGSFEHCDNRFRFCVCFLSLIRTGRRASDTFIPGFVLLVGPWLDLEALMQDSELLQFALALGRCRRCCSISACGSRETCRYHSPLTRQ